MPQPHDNEAMINIAIVLKALRNAIFAIDEYYRNPRNLQNPRFPQYESYELDGRKVMITYTKQMRNHLFRGTVDNNKEVVIKFTQTYCREAHALLDAHGYAPHLYWCGDVTSQFKMVVMEYVKGYPLLDYIQIRSNISKQYVLLL